MGNDFEIRDKRKVNPEGEAKEEQPQKPHEEQHAEPPRKEEAPRILPKADFMTMIMNLSAMAYFSMGLGPDTENVSLGDAQYIIDTLGVLEEKTRGNLTPDENKALEGILYELRMTYLKVLEQKS